MFSGRLNRFRHSVALRLTLLYAGIFTATSSIAFLFIYFYLISLVQERTDGDIQDDIREFSAFYADGGIDKVKNEMELETLGEDSESVFFRLWTKSGRLLASTDLETWVNIASPKNDTLTKIQRDEVVLLTLDFEQSDAEVRGAYGKIGQDLILEMGQSLEDDEEFIDLFLNGFWLTLALLILLGGPIGWFLARRALHGVQDITRTAIKITAGDFDQRVSVAERGTEFNQLAIAFNSMLDKIQRLIIGMREMSDNLAHDLRSPLGRIRATAEMAAKKDFSHKEVDALVSTTTEECDRLLEMINTTLDIAEAESGAAKYTMQPVNLTELVHDAVELFQPLAEDKSISFDIKLPESCNLVFDKQRLQRVVANLLDNAIKYVSRGGCVTVRIVERDGWVKLCISDNGIGISAADISRIFNRFFRCEQSRSESGNGLGLSLAQAIVCAHGGKIGVESTPGKGTIFTTMLPQHA